MRHRFRWIIPVLAAMMALLFSGCAADGIYALPQLSDDYLQLEDLISAQISSGGEYAAPVGGSNRQSVQLRDLDGDGETEAIAFLADEAHTPMICIYRLDPAGDYYLYVIIRGEGSSVGSVEYADLTGDGALELVVSWQISSELQLLSVYSLQEESIRQQNTEFLNADCSDFIICDLDGDGISELLDLRIDYAGTSTIIRYVFGPNGLDSEYEARLSSGITEVLRLRAGYLTDGVTALYIESAWGEDELITDVFSAGGGLSNITITASGRSDTLRGEGLYARDINGDRALEIPEPDGAALAWYGVSSSNVRTLAMKTYQSTEDGWYLRLSDPLLTGRINAVKTEDIPGETAVTFSAGGDGILVIYTLTGENRLDRAETDGRFFLAQNETTVYAAQLLPGGASLTEQQIKDDFSLIYPEWQTGERK